ncbi:MAG: hypothetical protein ACRC5C_04295, partial [Bacilli bacterium]
FDAEEGKLAERAEQLGTDHERSARELARAQQEVQRIQNSIASLETVNSKDEKEMQKIADVLLSDGKIRSVEEGYTLFDEQMKELERANVRLEEQRLSIQHEQRTNEETARATQAQYTEAIASLNRRNEQLQQNVDAEADLIARLADYRADWARYESVYRKESSIRNALHDEKGKLDKEKQEGLHRQRTANRLVDQYGDQTDFFADAYVYGCFDDLRESVETLVFGTEYIEKHRETLPPEVVSDPLWSSTLITTAEGKEKIQDKIFQMSMHLQQPIRVVAFEEVETAGNAGLGHFIYPNYWGTNLSEVQFAEWKHKIRQQAEPLELDLKEKEVRLTELVILIREWENFLAKYPYEQYAETKEAVAELHRTEQQLRETIAEQRIRSEQLHAQTKASYVQQDANKQQMQELQSKWREANRYLALQSAVNNNVMQLKLANNSLNDAEKTLRGVQEEHDRIGSDQQTVRERAIRLQSEKAQTTNDRTYEKVKHSVAIAVPHDTSLSLLVSEYENLSAQLNKAQKDRDSIEAKINDARVWIKKCTEEMDELLTRTPDLDRKMAFPIDGVFQIEQAKKELQVLTPRLEALKTESSSAAADWNKQSGKVENQTAAFASAYGERAPVRFDQPLDEASSALAAQLKKLKAQLTAQIERIEHDAKQLETFERAHHQLSLSEAKYEFAGVALGDAVQLDEATRERMRETPETLVNEVLDRLKTAEDALKSSERTVSKEKSKLLLFCERNISDVKMKKQVRDGVEQRTTYAEVKQHRDQMVERLTLASTMHTNGIREKDEKRELFLQQMVNHLSTVVEELNFIPNKTRVRAGDEWKRMFTFTIPEWKEDEAKQRLRSYIDWSVTQIDEGNHKLENGEDDVASIRKSMEMWLQTRNLLKHVFNNEVMKVSCRKIASDHSI